MENIGDLLSQLWQWIINNPLIPGIAGAAILLFLIYIFFWQD